jgi:Rrf2 family iron-sulfur cluster assembly transcriptional regulator
MTHDLWTNLNAKMVEYLDSVTLLDLVKQQESRGVVIADMRDKKVRVEPAKLKKTAVAALTKKEEAPKRPLINSVFNLARQG